MNRLRSTLLVLLSLALSLGSFPLHACVKACGKGDARACIRLCARSKALLTQDGKLDSIGAMSCSVQVSQADPALSQASVQLDPPQTAAILSQAPLGLAPLFMERDPLVSRGPPVSTGFLSSQHSFANAPPTFL